jgi:hypothetical protein
MAVARVSEITASSPKGFKEAIVEGFDRASKTLRGITGLEVEKMTAHVEKNKIAEFRVRMKVTFILED